jgi:hypothetical protein
MSTYKTLATRLGILGILIMGLTLLVPKAKADDACRLACGQQARACNAQCPFPPFDEGCREACNVAFNECVSTC